MELLSQGYVLRLVGRTLMIKMQVRVIAQARCPYCNSTKNVVNKDAEVFCYCDEKKSYSLNYNTGEDE